MPETIDLIEEIVQVIMTTRYSFHDSDGRVIINLPFQPVRIGIDLTIPEHKLEYLHHCSYSLDCVLGHLIENKPSDYILKQKFILIKGVIMKEIYSRLFTYKESTVKEMFDSVLKDKSCYDIYDRLKSTLLTAC